MKDKRNDNVGRKASLSGETVEPRILLSVTWISGDIANDTLNGTAGDDLIEGLGGNDVIDGGAGNDTIRGGTGSDTLAGGSGFDTVDYSLASGPVSVDLGAGRATGSDGLDSLSGFERVVGSAYADTLIGADIDETLEGGAGDDTIAGNGGDDTVYGGDGDDYIYAAFGDDILDGGQGFDTVDYGAARSGVHVDLSLNGRQDTVGGGRDKFRDIEQVIGSPYDDVFSFANAIDGQEFTVLGGAGSDVIDLSGFTSSQVTASPKSLTVDLGAGSSFVVHFQGIEYLKFSDAKLAPEVDLAPTADAGADSVVNEGDLVTLDATGSFDPNANDTLTYTWTQVSGPAVTLSDANAANPTFTAPEGLTNSTIRFQLTASDGTNTAVDTVDVVVNADNDAPTVNAGSDLSVNEGDLVTLNGTATDPEGQSLAYTWTQVSGPAVTLSDANTANPTFTAPNIDDETRLEFEVAVNDVSETVTDRIRVTIAPNDAPEVAIAGIDKIPSGSVGIITASASDADGDPLRYQWTQIGGPPVVLQGSDRPTLQFTAPDVDRDARLSFQIEVSDGENSTTRIVAVDVRADEVGSTTSPPSTDRPIQPDEPVPTPRDSVAPNDGSTTEAETGEGADPASQAISPSTRASTPTPSATVVASDSTLPTAADFGLAASNTNGSSGESSSGTILAVSLTDMTTSTDSTAAATAESSMPTDGATDTTENDNLGSLMRNLLEEDDLEMATSASTTSAAMTDLVVGDAGSQLVLRAPVTTSDTDSGEQVEVHWKQTAGTPVDLGDEQGQVLSITMPEVFVEEELVFEVEVYRGGERIVQEVAVQVQPVEMTSRSLSIDQHTDQDQIVDTQSDEGEERGIGKLWGALLAFFGAQTGRRRD